MSIRNLKSTHRKKYQRAMNKEVRKFNESIENDWLWNGRFVMCQKEGYFARFEDGSGGIFQVVLQLKDKKTGKVAEQWFDNYGVEWQMWEWANKTITETWEVWTEDPNPNEQARLEGRNPPPFK